MVQRYDVCFIIFFLFFNVSGCHRNENSTRLITLQKRKKWKIKNIKKKVKLKVLRKNKFSQKVRWPVQHVCILSFLFFTKFFFSLLNVKIICFSFTAFLVYVFFFFLPSKCFTNKTRQAFILLIRGSTTFVVINRRWSRHQLIFITHDMFTLVFCWQKAALIEICWWLTPLKFKKGAFSFITWVTIVKPKRARSIQLDKVISSAQLVVTLQTFRLMNTLVSTSQDGREQLLPCLRVGYIHIMK